MLAQFSIWPLDAPHMSRDIARTIEVLEKQGIRHEVNAMDTTVEGEWDEIVAAVRACHDAVRESHQRVLTSITIDDGGHSMDEAKARLSEQKAKG